MTSLLLTLLWLAAPEAVQKPVTFASVPAGTYWVGEAGHPRNPRREVTLAAFEISTTEITNEQFARFVAVTDYISDSERNGFGMTFSEGMPDWEWDPTPGATWRLPFGPDGPGIADKATHPVTQVSFNDAQAYCAWAGGRLPTIDEWEVAARAGSPHRWPWGPAFTSDGAYQANTWQGKDHHKNTREDGHLYTAPVASFAPNAWGLYDVIGNVFEYCIDKQLRNAEGELLAAGRGGSWWCSEGTCNFYNLVDIGQMDPRATLANQGFRMVRGLPRRSVRETRLNTSWRTRHRGYETASQTSRLSPSSERNGNVIFLAPGGEGTVPAVWHGAFLRGTAPTVNTSFPYHR